MSRPPKPPPPRPPRPPPPPPPPGTRPRTFEEVAAANAQDPFHAARLARLNSGKSFDDPAVSDPGMREVSVHPDCEGGNHWIVVIGRIFLAPGTPDDRPWMWASGHSADSVSRAAHGYEPTREAAMAAFAKSWRRE